MVNCRKFSSPLGTHWVCTTERGVCAVSFSLRDKTALAETLRRRFGIPPDFYGEEEPWVSAPFHRFLEGASPAIDLVADLTGLSHFQNHVLQALQEIPCGEVRSYQWVAERVGKPRASRAVGNACARNPVPLLIPCHRVIAKDGSIGGYRGGARTKRWLLDLESRSR